MPGRRFLIALGGAFFLVVLIRTAWLSELSYLTLRTVEHAATGHGLRWNVSERVQVFDHPLWMLLLLAGRSVSGESYFTTFVISLALSSATAVLVLGSARRSEGIVLGAALLSLSSALVTYSTSGLDGPLAHLLVVVFCLQWLSGSRGSRGVQGMSALAGLAALTQAGTMLITAPALLAAAAQRRSRHDRHAEDVVSVGPTEVGSDTAVAPDQARAPRILLMAAAPLLAWAVFATFYYGTPVPMPVIAEWTEHAGLAPRFRAVARLLAYVLRNDPITIAIILAGVAAGLRQGSRNRQLAAGTAAYGIVLALWAGDGMPGRWLALPCLVSTLIIVRHPLIERPRIVAAALATAAALAAVSALTPIGSDVRFGTATEYTDLRDSRLADYRATGLLLDIRQWYPPHHPEATRGSRAWLDANRVKTSPHPAYFGFAAGYGVHVIDRAGRTDPLLARLRPSEGAVFPAPAARRIPDGYEVSLPDAANAVADPALAAYYERVRLVTRGSLWDPWRLVAAARLTFARPPDVRLPLDASHRAPPAALSRP